MWVVASPAANRATGEPQRYVVCILLIEMAVRQEFTAGCLGHLLKQTLSLSTGKEVWSLITSDFHLARFSGVLNV